MMTSQQCDITTSAERRDDIKTVKHHHQITADVTGVGPSPRLILSLCPERKLAVTMKPSGVKVLDDGSVRKHSFVGAAAEFIVAGELGANISPQQK